LLNIIKSINNPSAKKLFFAVHPIIIQPSLGKWNNQQEAKRRGE
jgi:hypothetical protein